MHPLAFILKVDQTVNKHSVVSISEMLSLALHSMVLLAKAGQDYLSVPAMAKTTGCSVNHLAKVMQQLTRAGLVKAVRGPKGGFALNRAAGKISFLDIFEAVEAKINPGGCPVAKANCPFEHCIFDNTITAMNEQFLEFLQTKRLSDFTL